MVPSDDARCIRIQKSRARDPACRGATEHTRGQDRLHELESHSECHTTTVFEPLLCVPGQCLPETETYVLR